MTALARFVETTTVSFLCHAASAWAPHIDQRADGSVSRAQYDAVERRAIRCV